MDLKKCPNCNKNILVIAKTCKYCGKSIEQQEQNILNQEPIADQKQQLEQHQTVVSPPLIPNLNHPNNPKSNYKKTILFATTLVVVAVIILLVTLFLDKNETVVSLSGTDVVEKLNIVPQQETITSNNGNINNNSSPTITTTKTLKGKIGKLEAIYSLIWYSDGTINGTYNYPSRPNKIYSLQGLDKKNGKIELTEYTGSNISAKCNLTMQDNCYVGQMNNNDGRILNMTMCEVFDSTKDITSTNSHIPGIFPQASQRLLKPSDLYGMSKQDLKIMRNEIFARYGLIFKTSEMKSYFNSKSWYNGVSEDVTPLLSDIELKNVELIKSYE